jgi:succinate dehydrogenase/fumarate reductase flavoprotein subunit
MESLNTDVLIVGAGGAGLRAAIAAHDAGARTLVLTKGRLGRAGVTPMATSDFMAYSAAIGHADPTDSAEAHARDIVTMGAYVSDPRLARIIAEEAPLRLADLLSWGARFKETEPGRLYQFLTDGSSLPRACGKGPDTSWEIERVLVEQVRARDIAVRPFSLVGRLVADGGRAVGAVGVDQKSGEPFAVRAGAIILATGGAGAAYRQHVFPGDATGDGYALAYAAGATLVNMEFIQIIPSIIYPFKFSASGVFWRSSPRLLNCYKEEFLDRYIPPGVDADHAIYIKGVTAPFSIRNDSRYIDIGIFGEVMAGRGTPHGGVYLDLSHHPRAFVEERATEPLRWLLRHGIDIREQPVEVTDAVQHFNGGVRIGVWGQTAVPGLYAAGEAAGGQHGADRPGGNALADCQVFGARAGRAAAEFARGSTVPSWPQDRVDGEINRLAMRRRDGTAPWTLRHWLQELMWRRASVVRNGDGLADALAQLTAQRQGLSDQRIASPSDLCRALENESLFLVSEMVLRAALTRTESRGPHYRADFPHRDDERWLRCLVIGSEAGEMTLTLVQPDALRNPVVDPLHPVDPPNR